MDRSKLTEEQKKKLYNRVRNYIINHPAVSDRTVVTNTKTQVAKGVHIHALTEEVRTIRKELKQKGLVKSTVPPKMSKQTVYEVGMEEDEACYQADSVQLTLDWLEEHKTHPETGKLMCFPERIVRADLGLSQEEWRIVVNHDRVKYLREKLKGEYFMGPKEVIDRIRFRKAGG